MFPVTTHSKLSPSRLFRVFECPASFRFAQPYDQDTVQSPAAAEGEFMHTVVEQAIQKQTRDIRSLGLEVTNEQVQTAEAALEYLDNIWMTAGPTNMVLEEQVELKSLDPALYECGGTCDVHWKEHLADMEYNLHVLDWKFGRSEPIYAANNDQLMAYAWGLLVKYPQAQQIYLHIIMPRLDHYDTAIYTKRDMYNWLDGRAIPGALAAYSEHPAFVPGEKQCRWCPAKNFCRARVSKQRQTASDVFAAALKLPDDITIDEVADIMKDIPQLKSYIADLEKFAMSHMLQGGQVPGFKLVSGRSNRAWKSEEETEFFLNGRFDVDEIYTMKLKSPAQIEALDRKLKKDEEFKELYHKAQGNPTMVPEGDKRPALELKDAAMVFADLINEEE